MKIVSVRQEPSYAQEAIRFFQKHWASDASRPVYEDCILSSLESRSPLPQWYLLTDGEEILGGAGLIPNDFISRMDLYPWLCALYIEEHCRGRNLAALLIDRIKADTAKLGFDRLFLCTDLTGYYERFGFSYLAVGYHPWGERSKIYEARL